MKIKYLTIMLTCLVVACSDNNDPKEADIFLDITPKIESRSVTDFVGDGGEMVLRVTKGEISDVGYSGSEYVKVHFEQGKWLLGKNIMLTEDPAHIYCYYPDKGMIENGRIEVSNGTDFLYGGENNIATRTKPNVTLVLKHAMAYIAVNIKKGDYYGEGILEKIEILSANAGFTDETLYMNKGYMDVITGSIIPFEDEWFHHSLNGTSHKNLEIKDSGWDDDEVPGVPMIPFEMNHEGDVHFYYTIDGHRYVFDLPVMKFEKGKKYIFDVNLNIVDAITVRCVDWEIDHVDMGETQVRVGGLKYQETVSNKNLTVTIPDMGIVSGVIDWGDGNQDKYQSGITHTYAAAGVYIICIRTNNSIKKISLSLANRKEIDFRKFYRKY